MRNSMALREVARAVISLLENARGSPVVASEDDSLTTLAASHIGRGATRIHTISSNPSMVKEPDYLIHWIECSSKPIRRT